MPTEDMECFDPRDSDSALEWVEVNDGLHEMVMYEDEDGSHTRFFKMDPWSETTERKAHEFYEEVLILEGGVVDKTLDEAFTAGMYCCRTPGMEHGPYKAPVGCITFEHRYYD
jgi:hypothetical protein